MVFHALKRGYVHWASGRVSKVEVHTPHPHFAFVKTAVIPSMWCGSYSVKLILKKQKIRRK